MPERVELARPFAVVAGDGGISAFDTEAEAQERATRWGKHCADDGPCLVVRLTAERVEEPLPEAKSGWEWDACKDHDGDVLVRRKVKGAMRPYIWVALADPDKSAWEELVPPCDHAHVAALLRREGVE
jgi:hypothetical protein